MKATYHPRLKQDGIIVDQILTGGHQLPLGKLQDIHDESKTQNYDLGTRLVQDQRTFHYAQADGEILGLMGARCGNFPREGSSDAVIYKAGTYEITIPRNANGVKDAAEILADYWKDGYIWIQEYPFVTKVGEMHRIKSNTALVGGFITLTLYTPLKEDIAKSAWITAWPNPYKDVTGGYDARKSIICVPLIHVTDNYYFWGQTWGPIFMAGGTAPGRKDNDREIYARIAGAEAVWSGSDVVFESDVVPQRLGFLITNTNEWLDPEGGTEPGGDQFFMLQLSP